MRWPSVETSTGRPMPLPGEEPPPRSTPSERRRRPSRGPSGPQKPSSVIPSILRERLGAMSRFAPSALGAENHVENHPRHHEGGSGRTRRARSLPGPLFPARRSKDTRRPAPASATRAALRGAPPVSSGEPPCGLGHEHDGVDGRRGQRQRHRQLEDPRLGLRCM